MINRIIDKLWWKNNLNKINLLKSEKEEIDLKVRYSISNLSYEIKKDLIDLYIELLKTIPSMKKYESIKLLKLRRDSNSFRVNLDPFLLGIIDEDKEIKFINEGEKFFNREDDSRINILDPNFKNIKISLEFSLSYYEIPNNLPEYLFQTITIPENRKQIRDLLQTGNSKVLLELQKLFLEKEYEYIIYYNIGLSFLRSLHENKLIEVLNKYPDFEKFIMNNAKFYSRILDKYNLEKTQVKKEIHINALKETKKFFKF